MTPFPKRADSAPDPTTSEATSKKPRFLNIPKKGRKPRPSAEEERRSPDPEPPPNARVPRVERDKKFRLVPRGKGRFTNTINVHLLNGPSHTKYYFALLLAQPWWKIFLLMAGTYILFNAVFGVIFYWVGGFTYAAREETDGDGLTYWTSFFLCTTNNG